jgi:hypothetical protein
LVPLRVSLPEGPLTVAASATPAVNRSSSDIARSVVVVLLMRRFASLFVMLESPDLVRRKPSTARAVRRDLPD